MKVMFKVNCESVILVTCMLCVARHVYSTEFELEFDQFIANYKKNYRKGSDEYAKRLAIFEVGVAMLSSIFYMFILM